MLLTNGHNTPGILFLVLMGIFYFGCTGNAQKSMENNDSKRQLIEKGNACIEIGDYDQAQEIYSQFIRDHPDHPYVDDAAYRLAYITVIADDSNPYFSYEKAQSLFQNFIETYPNSRYINACTNWLNLLDKVSEKSRFDTDSIDQTGNHLEKINQLKNQLSALQKENIQLKKTLEELQRAIER